MSYLLLAYLTARLPRRSEDGHSSVEYIGLLLVITVLVALVLAVVRIFAPDGLHHLFGELITKLAESGTPEQ